MKNDSTVILAKNFDFEVDLGYIIKNRRGIKKHAVIQGTKIFKWTSKYGSITNNQLGKEFPLGGMNEAGLVIEELSAPILSVTQDSSKYGFNEFQIVQFLLDNCASVEEVLPFLDKIQLIPLIFHLHYIVTDKTGITIIIEFNEKNYYIHNCDSTGYPILSNNTYKESLTYLTHFEGFGGDIPIKNRPGSNERFVFVAKMLQSKNYANALSFASNILDSVKQMDTRWKIIYDPQKMNIYVQHQKCKALNFIKLKDLNFATNANPSGASIAFCEPNFRLHPFSSKQNKEVFQRLKTQYKILALLNIIPVSLEKLKKYGNGVLVNN